MTKKIWKELKEEIDFLRKDRDSFKVELSKMEEKLSGLAKDGSFEKRSQLDMIDEIEEDLHKKHTVIKNIRHELLEAQKEVEKKISDLNKTLKARDGKIDDLKKAVSELESKIEDQKKKYLEDMEELDKRKDKEAEKLKEEISDFKKNIAQLEDSIQVRYDANINLITENDEEIASLKKNIADLEKSDEAKNKELGELKEEISNFKQAINELEESIETGEPVKKRDKEISRLKVDIAWLRELNEVLKVQRESDLKQGKMMPGHDKTKVEKETETEKLKGEISTLRELVTTQKSFIEELEGGKSADGKDTRS